ncbi:hypothetical protein BGZ63DRAFT_207555 [Mariannaea sp. PMI_226]|nr:hypothetical protein BGZ63DRAFT_207555 [Mariannaea sp. PMI_226]
MHYRTVTLRWMAVLSCIICSICRTGREWICWSQHGCQRGGNTRPVATWLKPRPLAEVGWLLNRMSDVYKDLLADWRKEQPEKESTAFSSQWTGQFHAWKKMARCSGFRDMPKQSVQCDC